MTNEEFDKLCEELLAQGFSEEDILAVILQMFEEGKIDIDEMEKLAGARGYELSDEFREKAGALEEDKPSESADEAVEAENGEEFSKEEVEEAKEFEPGDKAPEAEEEEEEEVEEKSEDSEEKSDEAEGEDDEAKEKEETLKRFGV